MVKTVKEIINEFEETFKTANEITYYTLPHM